MGAACEATQSYDLKLFPIEKLQVELEVDSDFDWAWCNVHSAVKHLVARLGAKRVLEIGGGRSPLFDRATIEALGVEYIVNDVVQRELDRAPDYVSKARFDIAGDPDEIPPEMAGTIDVAFSRMVFEHVSSAERAYRNLSRLLRANGVALNFHPVLYSPPFVANWLLPEEVAFKVVNFFEHKERGDDLVPKFPARYSWCVIRGGIRERIRATGFSQVRQIPFYGHRYLRRVPVIRGLEGSLHKFAAWANFPLLASFSYTIVQK